ncbi:hypothetical protein BJ138DRAFT_1018479 [Hygrophoropsis aurantiaca]|uniref:Uncharacterized protein n=1 Tax=Hygrophoropsis aurantiaca TaxID=72124 RepID=A0ACB7ZUQ9_9AGAM|nr:hypothetical protein BJ138DRAFT_1018479 [Hygrophoropsis aurantiaca]
MPHPPRSAPPRPDPAHLASRKIASQQKKDANNLLHAAVKTILQDFQNKVAELAAAHNISIDKVQRLVGGYQNYASSRKPQLTNALVHAKAQELNKGTRFLSHSEVRKLVKADPEMQNLDPIQAQKYIDQLIEHRELQTHGMRANNTAAAKDMYSTLGNIFKSLDNLVVRTGGYAIVFATRGHVSDTAMPTWHGTHDAMDFFEDVLDLAPDDVCRKFEQWAYLLERDSLENVRHTCIKQIKSGLLNVTGKSGKEISMNYDNYETAIMKTLHVKLIGWPKDVPFCSPWKIYTIAEMKTLRDALKYGDCYWVTMSAREVADHTKSLTARSQAGETIGKPRAARSDRGKKRGKRTTNGKESGRSSKKARAGSQPKPRTNARTANAAAEDDDDDDEEDDHEGDELD